MSGRVEPIQAHGMCPAGATKPQGTQVWYSSDVGGHSTTVYSHISMSTRYLGLN